MVKLLLEKGAPVNSRDHYRKTALMKACDQPELIKLLLDNGADARLFDSNGEYALLHLVKKINQGRTINPKYLDVIELLLEKGADATTVPDRGISAEAILTNYIQQIQVGIHTYIKYDMNLAVEPLRNGYPRYGHLPHATRQVILPVLR